MVKCKTCHRNIPAEQNNEFQQCPACLKKALVNLELAMMFLFAGGGLYLLVVLLNTPMTLFMTVMYLLLCASLFYGVYILYEDLKQ
ncbi:hypothetical protein [Candidatus Uabimicrobium amorphum]|uniref:Uncharacterized protein n=1 Tax=Uabimicrobium amorphum TaxID=2596890 RepID=A0A5S9IHV2_UABAM|nr:hypothetical protein [Candidatus Uabimicrobium amorphum]BBM81766.1 hypothetical protein UABAM_00105 [Candidatus Uabimicrobium amorphum]